MKIFIEKSKSLKSIPPVKELGFGKFFTDHIFSLKYNQKAGWNDPRIDPLHKLELHPGASVFHYGQSLFEGMKAYHYKNNQIALFRPDFNYKRLQDGAERLCMKAPPAAVIHEGLTELVKLENRWIPHESGSALYLRPTLIGTEGFLGVRPSEEYLFFVICSPVGSYYGTGFSTIPIWIETEDLRAAPGGLGAVKAGANYAASLRAAVKAKQKGYSQVLWLDVYHQTIEEVGTMNVFFLIKDTLVTPALNGSILPGNTRDSVITLAKNWGIKLEERTVTLSELIKSSQTGDLREAFGTGTAAIISPIKCLESETLKIPIGNQSVGEITRKFYEELLGIQEGRIPDKFGWISII